MREYFDALYEAAERYRSLGASTPVVGEPWTGQPRKVSEIYAECFPPDWRRRCLGLLYRAYDAVDAEDLETEMRIRLFLDGFEYLDHTAGCYETLAAWQAEQTDADLAVHREAMAAREAHVSAIQQRDRSRGGELPPAFNASQEVLLRGPRDIYAELYAPLEAGG